ncbi:MAG: hypothetical protein AB1Z98_16180 [Nannocystaceae bacterium]
MANDKEKKSTIETSDEPTKRDLDDITPLTPEELQMAFGGTRRPRMSVRHHRRARRAM